MSLESRLDKLSVEEFVVRCREAMTPLGSKFSYFPAIPLSEEDVQEYLNEPIAALPPALISALPNLALVLVPYLEKPNGKDKNGKTAGYVSFEKPSEGRQMYVAEAPTEDGASVRLIFAIKDIAVSEYHYHFYRALAGVAARAMGESLEEQYLALLREELSNRVHGEVDQGGWHLKQALIRRQTNVRRETKLFREYAGQSFVDTMTLYLHGICCDVDVETGPRQLPSRFLRKRLELLEILFPPPEGYAVFPEELRGE
jgi:hypothetical protein